MTSQPTFKPQAALSLLRIQGEDTSNFLQGQLTNDITKLGDLWQYSGYCNPKGRLIALLILWQTQDSYYALLNSDLVESVTKRLRMYVLRSKVTIEVLDQTSISLINNQPSLSRTIKPLEGGFELASPAGHLAIQWSDSDSYENRLEEWFDGLIDAGIPNIGEATTELFIPQMINLDILDGINFKKGCYTGQEIVARMHYLGKLKQRMFVCEASGSVQTVKTQAGDKVYADKALTKSSGNIVSVTSTTNKVLAVLRIEHSDSTLFLENGQQISIAADQPYEFPPNKQT